MTAPDHPPGASPTAADVLAYWRGLGPQRWYAKDDAVDSQIRRMFLALHKAAARGLLADWEGDAERALHS